MKIITKNKKAFFDYNISEKYKAGIVLSGAEVKSVKGGQINLKGSWAKIIAGELWLVGAHIAPYRLASQENYDPTRSRKLLVTRKERGEISGQLSQKGLVLIPLEIFLDRNLVKVTLGLGRAKKLFDKRQAIKEKEVKRRIKTND